jgi:hypothetical protein
MSQKPYNFLYSVLEHRDGLSSLEIIFSYETLSKSQATKILPSKFVKNKRVRCVFERYERVMDNSDQITKCKQIMIMVYARYLYIKRNDENCWSAHYLSKITLFNSW